MGHLDTQVWRALFSIAATCEESEPSQSTRRGKGGKDRGEYILGAFPVSATGGSFLSTALPSKLSSAGGTFDVGLGGIPRDRSRLLMFFDEGFRAGIELVTLRVRHV